MLRAFGTPQVLIGVLLVIAAVASSLAPSYGVAPAPTIALGSPDSALAEVDVRLVIHDSAGLERSVLARLPVPEGASQRLATILAALRDELVISGTWPAALPAARVFVESFDRRTVAVIDMPRTAVGVSVAQELAILRSLTATAEANGAATVRFLRGGEPTTMLLEHVAVPASL